MNLAWFKDYCFGNAKIQHSIQIITNIEGPKSAVHKDIQRNSIII